MGRFTDINRGPSLNAAYTAYQTWLRKNPAERKIAYAAVSKSQTERMVIERTLGFIYPFASDALTIVYPIKQADSSSTAGASGLITQLKEITNAYIFDTKPSGAQESFGTYKYARVILTKRGTKKTGTKATSRMTGTPYESYETFSASNPFGRKDAATNYLETKTAMLAALNGTNGFLTTKGNRVGFIAEK